VKFNKPMTHKPELVGHKNDVRKSKTQYMIDSLGLEADAFGDLDKIDDLEDLLSDSDSDSDDLDNDGTDNSTGKSVTTMNSSQIEELKQQIAALQKENESVHKEKKV
jgi:hypothetical protein